MFALGATLSAWAKVRTAAISNDRPVFPACAGSTAWRSNSGNRRGVAMADRLRRDSCARGGRITAVFDAVRLAERCGERFCFVLLDRARFRFSQMRCECCGRGAAESLVSFTGDAGLNCDPIARWYRWLEYAAFGGASGEARSISV